MIEKLSGIIKTNITWLIIITTVIVGFIIYKYQPVAVIGDSNEYYLMMQSFVSHQSFDLTDNDIPSLQIKINKSEPKEPVYGTTFLNYGFYQAFNGKYYSYHFWGYTFVNIPVYYILDVLGLDTMKAFIVTNIVIFGALALFIFHISEWPYKKKILITLMALSNPVIMYVPWAHPEIFTYAMVVLAIIQTTRKKLFSAVLMASLGAMQNPPLIVLAISIIIIKLVLLIKQKHNLRLIIKNIILTSIPVIIPLIPMIFYWINFGTFSLISQVGKASSTQISIFKAGELFFDINIGLIAYIPILAILFICFIFWIIITAVRKRSIKKFNKGVYLFILLILVYIIEGLIASATTNWNSGMMYSARYGLWSILPLVVLVPVFEWELFNKLKILPILVILNVFFFIGIIVFEPIDAGSYTKMSYLSNLTLKYMPILYNPSPEIFLERVDHIDNTLGTPPYYFIINNKCKKVMIQSDNNEQLMQMIKTCGNNYQNNLCLEGYCYYSY